MINKDIINLTKDSKNLLAFSAGVDSSALFFLLLEKNIDFDIAIVNYNIREEAKNELAYAKELAKKYNKKIYTKVAPKITKNFEASAREFRYNFFNEIIKQYQYQNLFTAHQLNDKIEWLLMRLSKGAGTNTLVGMQTIQKLDNYNIIRPLLKITKDELLEYLNNKGYLYFIDKSNFEKKYERNRFRPIANTLLKDNKDGLIKSFDFLKNDSNILNNGYKLKFKAKDLRIIELNSIEYAPYALNYYLKELKYLPSYKEQLLIKQKHSIVIGRKWAIEIIDNLLYIAPYINATLPKDIKENFRKLKIPPKIRPYIFINNIKPKFCNKNLD